MKKLTFVILLVIVLFCAEMFSSKYLGLSIRPYGAPVSCHISSDIKQVLNCIRNEYMKYDILSAGWNEDLSQRYLAQQLNKLYRDTNFEYAGFQSIKPCYDKNSCRVQLRDEKYSVDTYKNIIAYVKMIQNTSSYTYNRSSSRWSNLGMPQLWMFSRSYKFPGHDIVIGVKDNHFVFFVLSMEAVPLEGYYDFFIGSVTAFCSNQSEAQPNIESKRYICGGYRFYFFDKINHLTKKLSLSLDRRNDPQYVIIKYGQASYRIRLDD